MHTDLEARSVEKKVQAMGPILSSKVLFSAIETIGKQIFQPWPFCKFTDLCFSYAKL